MHPFSSIHADDNILVAHLAIDLPNRDMSHSVNPASLNCEPPDEYEPQKASFIPPLLRSHFF